MLSVGQVFKFMGIPFAFHAPLKELWDVVFQTATKNIHKQSVKPMSLATKFQICTKIMAATYVYYSCQVPSAQAYFQLEKILRKILGLTPVEIKASTESIRHFVVYPKIKINCEFSILALKLRPLNPFLLQHLRIFVSYILNILCVLFHVSGNIETYHVENFPIIRLISI